MSLTYTYQKCCSAPTHFLVNTGFTASLYKTICFDQLIKAYIPTPRCLHQSVGVLGTGVPRLACLRPAAWLKGGQHGPTSSTRDPRPSRGAKPRRADDTSL